MARRKMEIAIHALGQITSEPNVEVIEVVKTKLTKVGEGTETSPVRTITEYWSRDGKLLAFSDPHVAGLSTEDAAKALAEVIDSQLGGKLGGSVGVL